MKRYYWEYQFRGPATAVFDRQNGQTLAHCFDTDAAQKIVDALNEREAQRPATEPGA